MRKFVPYNLVVKKRPPAPYKLWGPQAFVRWLVLTGFDTTRPFVVRWKDSQNGWLVEHSDYARTRFTRGPLAAR